MLACVRGDGSDHVVGDQVNAFDVSTADVIRMRDEDQLTYAQIAERVGLSYQAVRTRYLYNTNEEYRAKQKAATKRWAEKKLAASAAKE